MRPQALLHPFSANVFLDFCSSVALIPVIHESWRALLFTKNLSSGPKGPDPDVY